MIKVMMPVFYWAAPVTQIERNRPILSNTCTFFFFTMASPNVWEDGGQCSKTRKPRMLFSSKDSVCCKAAETNSTGFHGDFMPFSK